MPSAAALAENLRRPDYVALLCGTLEDLPQAFATLDEERRKAQRAGGPSPIDPSSAVSKLEIATAALPFEDRRVIRSPSMNARVNARASRPHPAAHVMQRRVASAR